MGATGPAGSALAARLASVGMDVVVGSRSKDRAQDTCATILQRWPDRELSLSPADNAVAADAEVVVIATPWDAAASTAASVAGQLEGKVVISMANALVRLGDDFAAVVPPRGSVAAHVQAALPASMVAAAFQHLPARSLAALDKPVESDVLVCTDHPAAYEVTARLVNAVPHLRALQAGSLASAAPVEALTAVLLQLNVRYRTRAALRLTGIDLDR